MTDFETLIKNDVSLLRLSVYEWRLLEESRKRGKSFTLIFEHEIARSAKENSLVIISVEQEKNNDSHDSYNHIEPGVKVGLVKSRQAVSTLESRVSFDLVDDLDKASLQALLSQISDSNLKASLTRLFGSTSKFQKISEKLSEQLVQLLLQDPLYAAALRPIIWRLNIPKRNENARALQLDAIKLALKAFGATETDAVEIQLSTSDTALAGARLQEDAVIEHDAREIDGWNIDQSQATGWARFIRRSGRDALEIFTANKRPLEELFGVDLIYLNHVRRSLVMVQYKMLEAAKRDWKSETCEEKEWTVRVDHQFKKELEKMTKFDKDLDPKGSYRLNPTAFFFKLVKRNAETKSAGIILSREHLQSLIDAGALTGPKAGLRISYRELDGHYIRSGGFVELVRSGYIGSRGATTEHLETLMQTAMAEGRAVVGAIQFVLASEPSRQSRVDRDFQALPVDETMAPDWYDNDDI